MKKTISGTILLIMMVLPVHTTAQSTGQKDSDTAELTQLQQDVAKLENEINQLKSEVRQLKNLLASQQQGAVDNRPQKESGCTSKTTGKDTGYWCSEASKKRHNSSCRYYKKGKGRPCGPKDGIPCKLCGG